MKLHANDTSLTITLEGWEVVLGLRKKLVIPRECITSLAWWPVYEYQGKLFRMFGTGFPGVLYAGYFRANGQPAYLYVKNPRGMSWTEDGIIRIPQLLVLTTENYAYPLVLLTTSEEIGHQLVAWYREK